MSSNYKTNLDHDQDQEEDSFRNESNPHPSFYNKIFETQVEIPFEKAGSFKDAGLEKNMKNYLKKTFKFSSQQKKHQGHKRSHSMNVLY